MLMQGRGQRRAMMTPSTLATRQHGDEWEQGQAHFAVAVALLNFPESTEIWAVCKAGPLSKAFLHSFAQGGLYVCCMRWTFRRRRAYDTVFRHVEVLK